MEITLYAKRRTTADGKKSFFSFLTTLTKKDGTPLTCSVRFTGNDNSEPDPDECPMNIIIEKGDCNLSSEKYTDNKTGEVRDSFRLWVKKWSPGSPWRDTSMDEFED